MAKNIFNSVQYPKVGSNTFDLSHDVKMSFQMGKLYPTFVMDCIPGDKIRMSTETMLRFAPLISPVMHRVNVTTHFFFVPNRILWPNWEKWITGELDVVPPYIDAGDGTYPEKSLADYLGVPTISNAAMESVNISAFPFAAYALIYDEYYRDQNLQNEVFQPLVNGSNITNYIALAKGKCLNRAWMHDYFTAALPFAQKGDAVTLPLGNFSDVPVIMDFNNLNSPIIRNGAPGPSFLPLPNQTSLRSDADANFTAFTTSGSATTLAKFDPNETLLARTSDLEAEAADINTLRRAFRLQEWLEKNARGGTRYIENIMAHFGVRSSDARLNRPEFLGGAYQKMVISEVLSTAETEVPVGQMAGHGISVGSGRNFTYRVEEHGWIIGLINVQPVTAYQQGIPRMYSREDRLDYLWPTFAHIGEQEVKLKELYCGGNFDSLETTFGYVPRYAEYRYIPSRVAGEMRSSLSHWHLGRIFSSQPSLNSAFVSANPSTRIFAVQTADADHIYGHIYNNVRAVRKLPKFGTPSF